MLLRREEFKTEGWPSCTLLRTSQMSFIWSLEWPMGLINEESTQVKCQKCLCISR